jgi:transcriptional regulator with XRE-family HTH domain
MSETPDIGARLFELRDSRGWTQDKVAEEAGVSHTTVVGLETGRIKDPRTVTLRRLARAFDMDLDEFRGEGVSGPKVLAP